MRAAFGTGGWVGVDDIGLPGPLYVRVDPAPDGRRLRVVEFYLDASQSENEITQQEVRAIPLSSIEAFINAHGESALAGGPRFRPVRHQPWKWAVVKDDVDFVLTSGPMDGLTDDFLRDVKRAYVAAISRGERPNAAIAEQTGYPRRSVERWVSKARDRDIMPRGRQGRVG